MVKIAKRVQIKPDFQEQLPKAPVDKKVEGIRQEYLAEVEQIKQRALLPESKERRIKELKERYDSRISFVYTSFYNVRLNIAKGNVAAFYSEIFDTLFPGKIMRRFKGDKETIANGEEINFHPDHIRWENDKKIFTEIKSISTNNSRPLCSDTQLENYCFDLLRDAEQPLFEPQLEYVFFRYQRSKKDPVKTSKLNNQELAQRLARKTNDLLMVPSNLFFLMMLASKKVKMDQTTNKGPDEAKYHKIYGELISQLHTGEVTPAEIARNLTSRVDLTKELCLDNLDYTRTESPNNLYYAIFKVKPFSITRYQNKYSRAWLEHFRQNHKRILTEIVGLKDIYQDLRDVPF